MNREQAFAMFPPKQGNPTDDAGAIEFEPGLADDAFKAAFEAGKQKNREMGGDGRILSRKEKSRRIEAEPTSGFSEALLNAENESGRMNVSRSPKEGN